MLYADDREKARETSLLEDGSYSFEYVAEGKYILQLTGAQDEEQKESDSNSANAEAATVKSVPIRHYTDKEIPLSVLNDIEDMNLAVAASVPGNVPATVANPVPQ
jgi:hypothetical protein